MSQNLWARKTENTLAGARTNHGAPSGGLSSSSRSARRKCAFIYNNYELLSWLAVIRKDIRCFIVKKNDRINKEGKRRLLKQGCIYLEGGGRGH